MEIRVLRYFLAVVREENITKAAEVLHVTQPTLSRQLAQLEEEIGVKLFDRGARKIALTNAGVLLRRWAEEILRLVDKTQEELDAQEEQIEGEITVGCGELASVQLLARFIATFQQSYPAVTYDILTETADVVKEQMDKGLVDIGLLLEPVDMEKYDFVRLSMKERWVVLMRQDAPLAGQAAVTPQDLAGVPLILPRRLTVQSELASWFGDAFQKLNVRFTSNLSSNAAVMVDQGLGYCICVEGFLPFWDNRRLVYRPLAPELTATSVLAWKRNQPFSPAVAKFIQHLQYTLRMGRP